MHEKTSCEAGVGFATLQHYGTSSFRDSCPCFGPEQTGECEAKEYPTVEELAARDAEMAERFAKTAKARAAIVEAADGKRGVAGEIPCPVCETGKLRYSVASLNGHVHAACTTADCVRWME
mgnify:CR=1 FL=1